MASGEVEVLIDGSLAASLGYRHQLVSACQVPSISRTRPCTDPHSLLTSAQSVEQLNLKEDLLRGIYAYSEHFNLFQACEITIHSRKYCPPSQTLRGRPLFNSEPSCPSSPGEMSLHRLNPVPEKPQRSPSPSHNRLTLRSGRPRRLYSHQPGNWPFRFSLSCLLSETT